MQTETKKNNENLIEFQATFIKYIFNSDNFQVCAMSVDSNKYPNIKINQYGNISITGDLPELIPNVAYSIKAKLEQGKYDSYKVVAISSNTPQTKESVMNFLSEILTINQAEVLFQYYPDIIDRVKNHNLDDIDLSKLKGIKDKTFKKIVEKIEQNYCLMDLIGEFKGYLTLSMIKKIYNKYNSIDLLKKKIKQNPYKCLCDLAGVGFKTADKILLSLEKLSKDNINQGQAPIIDFEFNLITSENRCLASIKSVLQKNEENGNTTMILADLRTECLKLTPECIEHFGKAMQDNDIYYDKEKMIACLQSTYNTELYIAQTIAEQLKVKQQIDYDLSEFKIIDNCELSDEQIQSLQNLLENKVSILNGAAGVGKSFTTQALIKMLDKYHQSYLLLAPTGKASKVIAEYTHRPASTIHRGLGYSPQEGWGYNKTHKLPYDVIIVDEFSMVDIFLMKHLLEAIDFTTTKLLLIGDNCQLPSVSCGNLLHDFMMCKLIPTTTLTKVFRYGEGGLMTVATDTRNCKQYLDKNMSHKTTCFGNNKDYIFTDMVNENIPDYIVTLYQKILSKDYHIKDIQVLVAQKKGNCGVINLNNEIQKAVNRNCHTTQGIKYGDVTYYKDDIVIQIQNNYKAKIDKQYWTVNEKDNYDRNGEEPTAFIANGETGVVKYVCSTYMVIDFDGVYIRYEKGELSNINLGYVITIHKSQGSSSKIVILATPSSHFYMLNSNLIYVGQTRTKERCFHIGSYSSINKSIKKKANFERHTLMQSLIKQCYVQN